MFHELLSPKVLFFPHFWQTYFILIFFFNFYYSFLVLIHVVVLLTAYAWRTPFLSNRIACTEAPGNHFCTPACPKETPPYRPTPRFPSTIPLLANLLLSFSNETQLKVEPLTLIRHTTYKMSSTVLVCVMSSSSWLFPV